MGISARKVGRMIAIRDYHGDGEDAARLMRRVWTKTYQGQIWFPLWSPEFLRWQFGEEDRRLCVAAYDDDKLIGTYFATPHSLRMGSTVYPMTFSSWCTVDQDYRLPRLTVEMIEAMRRAHRETGRALSLGVVNGSPTSLANRFWTLYGKANPQNYRVVGKITFWSKVLNTAALVKGSIAWWERALAQTMGPVLAPVPWARGSPLRPYRADDLDRCAQLLARASAPLEWAVEWPAPRLARQLEGPVARTLVYERDGRVQALLNYHHMQLQGNVEMKFAMIDLCALPDVSPVTAARVFGGACAQMRDEGVDVVVCQRSALFPTAALIANGFIPLPGGDQLVALFPQPDVPLESPRTWNVLVR
jgi:hypothetical protein